MAIYSKKLAAGFLASGSNVVVFTAPAGVTTVVRCITAFSEASGSSQLIMRLVAIADFFAANATFIEESFLWDGRLVLDPGDELEVQTIGGGWGYTISGYELN